MSDRPQLRIITPGATPRETAVLVAVIEQFLRDTAPEPVAVDAPRPSAWKQAALAEGVSRRPDIWPY